MTEPTPRFTLRQLPLPAKLVVTLFMLTVGLGYSSAMVQMHFQHTQGDGTPMPGKSDVIEIFAGKRWVTKEEAEKSRPKSKFETLVLGSKDVLSSSSMGAAFYGKDPTRTYQKLCDVRTSTPETRAKIDAEREGERKALELWGRLPDDERKAAYESDSFKPVDKIPSLTKDFRDGETVKVKSIINTRCTECHQEGGTKSEVPLDSYSGLAKVIDAPADVGIPEGADGAWCASSRQVSKEKLAQSTHAHLLSFAMLFTLTGLVFSFSSYPALLRGTLGPIVLLAQVADVCCWWLARLDGPGIYFAQAIMATGAVVGLGLTTQIVLSVFNMYGKMGKFALALLFLGAGAGGYVVFDKVVIPQLNEQKAKKEAEAEKKAAAEAVKPEARPEPAPAPKGANVPVPPSMPMNLSLDKLLAGKWDGAPWGPDKTTGRVPEGGMVRAFFDKDTDFKDAVKNKAKDPEAFKTIQSEREGEQSMVLAWAKSAPEVRKKAFEKDEFPMPMDMKGKPMTGEFLANDKAVKIKSIFEARCSTCHGAGTKVELDNYEALEKFLK